MIETKISYIEKIDSGIIHVKMKDEAEVLSEYLEENVEIYKSLLEGESGLFLIEMSSDITADVSAHKSLGDKNRNKFKRAEAFLITELPQRLYSKFYQWYHQPSHPVKVFSDKQEAIKWLETF